MVFDPGVTPQPPDYSKADGWAVLPGIHPDFLKGFDKNLNNKLDPYHREKTILGAKVGYIPPKITGISKSSIAFANSNP